MEEAAAHLAALGVRLVAIDFDMTLIDRHTGGQWLGEDPGELAAAVRPVFRALLPLLLERGLCVGIATFSPQTALVRAVLVQVFGEQAAQQVCIRGNDGAWTHDGPGANVGKQGHLASLALHFEGLGVRAEGAQVLLIDDDWNNVGAALRHGGRAVVCADGPGMRAQLEAALLGLR